MGVEHETIYYVQCDSYADDEMRCPADTPDMATPQDAECWARAHGFVERDGLWLCLDHAAAAKERSEG